MRQSEIDVLNFENKLLQDRRELNDLIYQSQLQGVNKDIICEKLQNMRREMDFMGSQLDMLQKAVQEQTDVTPQPVLNLADTAAASMPQPDLGGIPDFPQIQQQTLSPAQIQTPPAQKDLEKTFGKFWMGVIASGLVFVSFIFFAVMLLPVLTDGIKIAAMFIISFIFIGAGLTKLSVDKENKFYLALCGCGVGGVYISLLVSNIYFKVIGDILLYLLLFVWAVGVCYLRRRETALFQLIGQIGITIAIVFGCRVCIANPDAVRVLMLAVFYAASSMIFMGVHRQKILSKNGINIVFNLVNLGQLAGMLAELPDSFMTKAVAAVLLLYAALFFLFCYRCEASEDGLDFGIITVVCIIFAVCILNILLQNVTSGIMIESMTALVICILSLAAAETKLAEDAATGRAVIQIAAMVLMFYFVCIMEIFNRHIYLAVLMIPFLTAGFLKRNWFFKYGSLIYMVLFQFHIFMDYPEKMFWGYVYFGILVYFMRREKEHYHSFFKMAAYVLFLIKLSFDCAYIMSLCDVDIYAAVTVCCIVTGGINMAVFRRGLMVKNAMTGASEPESILTLYVIHAIQMCVIIVQILLPPGEYSGVITIPWALVLFMANTKKILAEKKDTPAGFYIGVKFTILLSAVLASLDISGVLASVCCFALAVSCIVAGFYMECKSLRIYSLILSMFSVFKLALIDIAFGGFLQLAAGFFTAGILCFVISRIYNSIDEKFRNIKIPKN